ncbi:MAG: PDZ domain-containing protein [Isosphaeraceae bacterium]
MIDPSRHEPIRYLVRFPDPRTHYAEVEARFPASDSGRIELMMPVWTPGSYMVREYSRNVEAVVAIGPDGKGLPVAKARKNRWAVEAGGPITVRYRVYGREMTVRSNFVEEGFALLNGAPTFLAMVGGLGRPHEVAIELPPGWLQTCSGLEDGPRPHTYVAPDYDTLVDSPIVCGNPAIYPFEVDGIPHFLVNEGEGGVWDGPRSARDVETIVRAQRDFWGPLPYRKYVFLNLITEAGGGLEHKNSTVLMTSRWATRTRRGYLAWLNLVSHEFFHTWNVKRLRPVELGPFDYENEVYTRCLWVAEGFTEYYGRLLVLRAGLCSRDEYLAGDFLPGQEKPATDVETLQNTPGRLVQPLESASFDAWIKYYRPDENSPNTAVSYYIKGAVVAWLIDAKIRKATADARSLDDVMRIAFERFSGERGYTSAEIRSLCEEVAGVDLSDWFRGALETTEELDYRPALDWFGLRFKAPSHDRDRHPRAWLGMSTRVDLGRLLVDRVKRGTPAYEAGFNSGDEVVAIGEYRVRADQWTSRLEQYRPNEKVSVLIARRDRLMRLDATFGEDPSLPWGLEVQPDAGEAQQAHRRSWLGS